MMDEKISLIKPVPDNVYSVLDESQIRFFATVGYNFWLGLKISSSLLLMSQYKSSVSDQEVSADAS